MESPWKVYDQLLAAARSESQVKEILIGLTWTLCHSDGIGLAMSPGLYTRVLPWSGTLVGKPISELTAWLRSWDPYQASIGMAAVNAILNVSASPLLRGAEKIKMKGPANLAVFEYFAEQIKGQAVVIGRYPGLDEYKKKFSMTVLERQPGADDLPDPACEYLLPDADWVFLTAGSLTNKTFPRLAALAKNAKLVLMGPTVPWLQELADHGVNYLAGVRVSEPELLRRTIAEGGGTRIFEQGLEYCVTEL